MPILTGTLTAVTGGSIDTARVRRAYVRAPQNRGSLGSEGGLVTSVPVPVPTSGELSLDLEPGPAILVVDTLDAGQDVFDLYVTADMTLISEALAEAAPAHERSWVESQLVKLRGETETLAGAAQTAKGDAEGAAQAAASHRQHVDQIRDLLDEAAQSNVAPYLTQTALNATYVPDVDLPAKTATNVASDQAVRDAVARAAIEPSTMSLASTIIARNAAETPLPKMVTLVDGSPNQTPQALGGFTYTNVDSPTEPGRKVWHTVGNYNQSVRCRINFPTPVNAFPATAISTWVYLPRLEDVDNVQLVLYTAGSSWVRGSHQVPVNPLRQGWNNIRHSAQVSLYNNLTNITGAQVQVNLKAGVAEGEFFLGPIAVEQRPKASVVFINDWGNKTFYDNAYPALKAAGIPVTWALRVGLLGTGTYPDNHISLAEARTVMNENGNSVSFHSWDGDATSGMTREQYKDQVLRCQAGLSARGLWNDGAVHRPAVVQNVAPNAPAADPYLVTSGTYQDSYLATTWPPVNRMSIPRVSIYMSVFDAQFDVMRDIRGVGLFYTHGVVPTAAEAGANHATQAQFDHFLSRVTTGMSEGWLEAVTIQQLVARERLTMPVLPPPVTPVPAPVPPA